MCFRKSDDPYWPYVFALLPLGTEEEEADTDATSSFESKSKRFIAPHRPNNKKNNVIIRSIQEVLHDRENAMPRAQISLHMALQRNAPLPVVNVLLEASERHPALRLSSLLNETDQDGDTPIMTAIRHGVNVNTIQYLYETTTTTSDAATTSSILQLHQQRARDGKTPLHLAVEYCCSTVQSSLLSSPSATDTTDTVREVSSAGAHPDQVDHDENSLSVLRFLLQQQQQQQVDDDLILPSDHAGHSPLHTAIMNRGPGREEVLRIVLQELRKKQASSDTTRRRIDQEACRQMMLNGKTPLHCACEAEYFSEQLVEMLMECEPTCVALKSSTTDGGITPLFSLCHQQQQQVEQQRRRASPSTMMIPEGAAHRLISKMITAMPNAVRIQDAQGRLPLHAYMENEYLQPKDPQVVALFLHHYDPASVVVAGAGGSSIVVLQTAIRDALFSRYPNEIEPSSRAPPSYWNETTYGSFAGKLDPTLVCLWQVLRHSAAAARQVIQVVQLFWHKVDPDPRYGMNARSVMRIAIYWLFQETYGPYMELVKDEVSLEDPMTHFPGYLVRDTKNPVDALDPQAVKDKIINTLYRDFDTVSKMHLLPELDVQVFEICFPTLTPYITSSKHVACPCYKPLSFHQWCADQSIPCRLNRPIVQKMFDFTPVPVMAARYPMFVPLVEKSTVNKAKKKNNSHSSISDEKSEVAEAVLSMKQKIESVR